MCLCRNGYSLYCAELMVNMKDVPSTERMVLCSKRWKLMTQKEKDMFQKRCEQVGSAPPAAVSPTPTDLLLLLAEKKAVRRRPAEVPGGRLAGPAHLTPGRNQTEPVGTRAHGSACFPESSGGGARARHDGGEDVWGQSGRGRGLQPSPRTLPVGQGAPAVFCWAASTRVNQRRRGRLLPPHRFRA